MSSSNDMNEDSSFIDSSSSLSDKNEEEKVFPSSSSSSSLLYSNNEENDPMLKNEVDKNSNNDHHHHRQEEKTKLIFVILVLVFFLCLCILLLFVLLFFVLRDNNNNNDFQISTTDQKNSKYKPLRNEDWIQVSENDNIQYVLMHIPSDESFFGSLHPSGALFETSFDLSKARSQILKFQNFLIDKGIKVFNIRDILSTIPKEKLIPLSMKYLTYKFKEEEEINNYFQSEEYKYSTLSKMSISNLIDILFLQPTVYLQKSEKNTEVKTISTSLSPLYNLLFTRDQQITTKLGIILGKLNSPQRSIESEILELVWNQLGITPIYKTKYFFLEGGDFIPISESISMIGVGLRTSYDSVKLLLEKDLFGTEYVAVVVDLNDHNQDRMHLDTVFNTINDKTVVLLDLILNSKENNKYFRRVDLYHKNEKNENKYFLKKSMSLPEFLKNELKIENIIPISNEYQMKYMINFLNLGRDIGIASVHPEFENVLRKNNVLDTNVFYFDFEDVHAMYGALHCTTQVSRRRR